MLTGERRREIVRLLEERQVVRIDELAKRFGVSEVTVRRDLKTLQNNRNIERTRGGALLGNRELSEAPLAEREVVNRAEKQRIGRAAAQYVQDGDTIIIGGGTTTAELARSILDRRNLVVITPTINIATILADAPQITVLITGGVLLGREMTLAGHFGERALAALHADKLFFGVNAVCLKRGLTSAHPSEIGVDLAMLRAADERILLADHTKFGRASTCVIGEVNAVERIITDSETPEQTITLLREMGVEVICV
jgi:DeoR/GlpR family transcriptional regulator of sugar metabolism